MKASGRRVTLSHVANSSRNPWRAGTLHFPDEASETVVAEQPSRPHFELGASRMDGINFVHEAPQRDDTWSTGTTETLEVRPHRRHRRQPTTARILRCHLELLGVDLGRESHESRLDPGDWQSAMVTHHQRPSIGNTADDDAVCTKPPVGVNGDDRHGIADAFEAVPRRGSAPDRDRVRACPRQGRAQPLLGAVGNRNDDVHTRMSPLDDSGPDQGRELLCIESGLRRVRVREDTTGASNKGGDDAGVGFSGHVRYSPGTGNPQNKGCRPVPSGEVSAPAVSRRDAVPGRGFEPLRPRRDRRV